MKRVGAAKTKYEFLIIPQDVSLDESATANPYNFGHLVWGKFLITVLISLLIISLLRFSVSHNSVLEGGMILRICPFLLDCSI